MWTLEKRISNLIGDTVRFNEKDKRDIDYVEKNWKYFRV